MSATYTSKSNESPKNVLKHYVKSFSDNYLKSTEVSPEPVFGSACVTGSRSTNEDCLHTGRLSIVCDGNGETAAVAIKCKELLKPLKQLFKKMDESCSLTSDSFAATMSFIEKDMLKNIPAVGGSTVLVTYFGKHKIFNYSLGDCRCCLVKKGQYVRCVTEEVDFVVWPDVDPQIKTSSGLAFTNIACFTGEPYISIFGNEKPVSKLKKGTVVVTEDSMDQCYFKCDKPNDSEYQHNLWKMWNMSELMKAQKENVNIKGCDFPVIYPIKYDSAWRTPEKLNSGGYQPIRLAKHGNTNTIGNGEITIWNISEGERNGMTYSAWCDGLEDNNCIDVNEFPLLLNATDLSPFGNIYSLHNKILGAIEKSTSPSFTPKEGFDVPESNNLEDYITWLLKIVIVPRTLGGRLKLSDNVWRESIVNSCRWILTFIDSTERQEAAFITKTQEGLDDLSRLFVEYANCKASADNCSIIIISF